MDMPDDESQGAALPEYPRLRRVDGFPVSQPTGETLFALRDPEGFSGSVVLPYQAAVLASLLDGSRTLPELQAALEQRLGHEVEADDVVLAIAAEVPVATPVVVVSSDGRVRDGARVLGANVVSTPQLCAAMGV